MEKSQADILNELVSSRKIIMLPGTDPDSKFAWLIFPYVKDKILARNIYEFKLKEFKNNGILTVDDSISLHKKLGLWDDVRESQLEKLPRFIDETVEAIKNEKNKVRRDKYSDWLKKLQRDYLELIQSRNGIICGSAEYLANTQATAYLVWQCFRDLYDNRLWNSFEDLCNSKEVQVIEELSRTFVDGTKDLEISVIRSVARGGNWRVRWNACKNDINSLFGRSAQDLTNDQFMLLYWSQVYDSVYESLDRPPDSVINNDEELDKWLKEQGEERERQIGQKFYSKSTTTVKKQPSKIEKAAEVFKVVDGRYDENGVFVPYTEEERWKEIEKIRGLNSRSAKMARLREEEKLKRAPGQFIQEHHLRTTKEDREALGGNVERKIIK